MNDRKQHVIKMAHQLFIDKGFQATSIQDILDFSGISKGTFYNYFASKNELLIAIFKSIYQQVEQERSELLIGQDPSDVMIFIQQIVLQMKVSRRNKLIGLYEEVMVANDADLKEFIDRGQIRNIRWLYHRLMDIFGEEKKPYLLDCAIMFLGMLRQNIKFYQLAYDSNARIELVVQYSVNRLVKLVEEAADSKEQLLKPEFLENWLPSCKKANASLLTMLKHEIIYLKNKAQLEEDHSINDLLDFIEKELMESKHPRKFLIDSAILSIKMSNEMAAYTESLTTLEALTEQFFSQINDK